jgi:hypothetical protein
MTSSVLHRSVVTMQHRRCQHNYQGNPRRLGNVPPTPAPPRLLCLLSLRSLSLPLTQRWTPCSLWNACIVSTGLPLLRISMQTCLLISQRSLANTSNNRYETTTCEGLHTRCSSSPSFHSYSAEGMSDGWQICLQLRDIARQKDSNRLRTPSCPQTSIFIVCFSTVSPANFDNFQPEVFQTSQL